MLVKICGITNAANASAAAECGADYIGLVLAKSPRRVTLETARLIASAVSGKLRPVLVTRDLPLAEVVQALQVTGVAHVQLHGRESPDYFRALAASAPGVALIRGLEILAQSSAAAVVAEMAAAAALGVSFAAIILDAPKGCPHPGFGLLGEVSRSIHQAFDEHPLPGAQPPQVWCAGGLTPANVQSAISAGVYQGVDVARGVETRPGVKDHTTLRRFVQAAKSF